MTKLALKDPETGLFPNEERFARLVVGGLNYSDAYRAVHTDPRTAKLTDTAINQRAAKMANKPSVSARVRLLLSEAKISDLDTLGKAFNDLMRFIEKAEKKENFTALAALMRLRLQVIGALKENVLLNVENTISDDELVKRLAEKNPALASVLRKSLGHDNAYAA